MAETAHETVPETGAVRCELLCGDYREALADVERVDAVIVDAPYSDRTHGSYREMESLGRSAIGYACWSENDVNDLVACFSKRCTGWWCSLTDHLLAPAWERALSAAGLYVFSPIACVEPGARVRLCGDGPAQWSVWLVVARPRMRAMQQWGALPGAYVVPSTEGWRGTTGGRSGVMGGKPLWLMRAIIRDYSRPGDLVCDPCAGGATTLLAARMEGRSSVGSELDPETFRKATERLAAMPAERLGQLPIFGENA